MARRIQSPQRSQSFRAQPSCLRRDSRLAAPREVAVFRHQVCHRLPRPPIPWSKLLIIDELGFVPLSKTGAELLFEVFSQRYERGSVMVTTNLPFDEWTEVFGSERLTGALLDRLTHHVHILEMNGESYRLKQGRQTADLRGEPSD